MSKRQLTRYAVMFVLLVLSFTFAPPTYACLPPWIPLEERLDTAPIVLIGIITEVEVVSPEDNLITMQVEVETYLQGKGLEVLTIEGYHNLHPCNERPSYDYPFLGWRTLFFVYGDGATLHTQYYDWNSLYPVIDDDWLADLVAYINDPLRPLYRLERHLEKWRFTAPFVYVQREISYRLQSIGSTMLIVVSLVVVDVLMVILVIRRWIAYNRLSPTKRG